jgi:hypothetical protein
MLTNPFKIFLLILIIFSKEFLIFNEEILIVLSFLIFIYLVLNNAAYLICEELDLKSKTIQNKFDVYKNIQEKTILFLSNYYKKRKALSEKIKNIANIRKSRINILNFRCKTNLKKKPLSHLEEILNQFILNDSIFNIAFQKNLVVKLTNK